MEWVWVFWLLVVVLGSFAALEGYALTKDKTTLSRTVWKISKAFPLFPFIVGAIVGGLAVHFWWGGIVCFSPV